MVLLGVIIRLFRSLKEFRGSGWNVLKVVWVGIGIRFSQEMEKENSKDLWMRLLMENFKILKPRVELTHVTSFLVKIPKFSKWLKILNEEGMTLMQRAVTQRCPNCWFLQPKVMTGSRADNTTHQVKRKLLEIDLISQF